MVNGRGNRQIFIQSLTYRWLEEEFHQYFIIQFRIFYFSLPELGKGHASQVWLRSGTPSLSNSTLSLRTPFPLLQLAFSPLRHFLGHAHCEKGRKAITSAEKRQNFECQICVLIWYRFRPIPFSSRYSLFRGPYLLFALAVAPLF